MKFSQLHTIFRSGRRGTTKFEVSFISLVFRFLTTLLHAFYPTSISYIDDAVSCSMTLLSFLAQHFSRQRPPKVRKIDNDSQATNVRLWDAKKVYEHFKKNPTAQVGRPLITETGWTESSLRRAKNSALAGRDYHSDGGRPNHIPVSVQNKLFYHIKDQGLSKTEFFELAKMVHLNIKVNHGNNELLIHLTLCRCIVTNST